MEEDCSKNEILQLPGSNGIYSRLYGINQSIKSEKYTTEPLELQIPNRRY